MKPGILRLWLLGLVAATSVGLTSPLPRAAATTGPDTTASRPAGGKSAATAQLMEAAARLQAQLAAVTTLLERDEGAAAALESLKEIRAELLNLDSQRQAPLFRQTARLWRTAQLLGSLSPEDCQRLRRLGREHPALLENLLLTLSPAFDHPAKALALMDALCQRYPRLIDRYANLAVALCVVRDTPPRSRRDRAAPADPLELFAFYLDNERHLLMNVRELPPELLVYVVDVQASLEEMQWAVERYQGQRNIGVRFFDVSYDMAVFLDGAAKQVERRGYSLPNLLKYGGICVDQAYFAASVGKSLGVPAVSMEGSGADVGHAWLGYLEAGARETRWNMESGRYDAYRGVRASTLNPQTGEEICEGELSLLAELLQVSPANRLDAIALADIAAWEEMKHLEEPAEGAATRSRQRPETKQGAVKPRREAPPGKDAGNLLPQQEKLLLAAVQANPACLAAWRQVEQVVPRFDAAQRAQWGAILQNLCGRRHPDFAVKILTPMIEAIEDPVQQDLAWEAAARLYRGNVDVTADILLAQAQLWRKHDDPQRAVRLCEAVTVNCAASGPRVLEAVRLAEATLVSAGQEDLLLRLYATAFARIRVPGEMDKAIVRTTAWYEVGQGYVQQLEAAGDGRTASQVARRLKNMAGEEDLTP